MPYRLYLSCAILALAAATARGEDRIHLTNGDQLRGQILERNEQAITLQHPVLGRLEIPRTNVRSVLASVPEDQRTLVEPVNGQDAPDAPATPQLPPPPPRRPLIQPVATPSSPHPPDDSNGEMLAFINPFRPLRVNGWKSRVELGFTGTEGNSDTTSGRFAFRTHRETRDDRWRIEATYYFSSANRRTNRNQFTGTVVKDWLMPESKWFVFAQGSYEYDQFNDWDQRIAVAVGPGYQWIKTDKIDLRTRAGVGGNREFGSDDDDFNPEGLVGAEFVWKITDRQSISATSTIYPRFEDPSDHRIISSVDWLMRVDEIERLSLKLGLQNEYQSRTEDGAVHSDSKFYGALVLDF